MTITTRTGVGRLVTSALLLLGLLTVMLPPLHRTVFESAPFQRADAAGLAYVDAAFERALIAFALARTANAVISVIQGSTLELAPAGIGMTVAIGEVLDPLNDMIERFSWIMLLSLVALGIQKLLLEMVPWLSVTVILAPALLLLLAGLWWPAEPAQARRLARLGGRLLLLAVLLRFAVPLTAWLNDRLYERFLAQRYAVAIGEVEQGNALLKNLHPPTDAAAGQGETVGLLDQFRARAQQLQEAVDLQRRLEALKERFGRMIEQLLMLIVVFLLNSVLLPLAFLGALLGLGRQLLTAASRPARD